MQFLTPTHPEWAHMWEWLCDIAGHYTDINPASHEQWEYTGTYWRSRSAIGSLSPTQVLVHEFRHRDRPETARPIGLKHTGRVMVRVAASWEFSGNWNHPIEEGSLQ